MFHLHSAFPLCILEYINISDLSKKEAQKLPREQDYLDLIFSEDAPNTYNLLKIAGSLLGSKHKSETIVKMSGQINRMYGKTGKNHS